MPTMLETKLIRPLSPLEDRRREVRVVFSAFQLGKICDPRQALSRITQGSLDELTAEMPASALHELYIRFPELDFLPVMHGAKLAGYVRYVLGEGIEKEVTDFAAEVASVVNG